MAQERESLEVGQSPELLRLAEDVSRSGRPRILRHGDEPLAIVRPIRSPRGRRTAAGAEPSPNAWLDDLIGIGKSEGAVDVSERVHNYLSEAVLAETDDPSR